MSDISRDAYPRSIQILHWTILALVAVQWLSADGMGDFFDRADDTGISPGLPGPSAALIHAISGATILILMLTRFGLRLRHGAPAAPSDLPPLLRLAARATHYAFYVVLILLPLTGATALLINPEAGDVHEALKTVLLILLALHVGGVAYHMLVLRDGLLWRMLPVRR